MRHRQSTTRGSRLLRALSWLAISGLAMFPLVLPRLTSTDSVQAALPANQAGQAPLAVLGYSELGMHCMNEDFSALCVLPPYNTMFVDIIDRSGSEPHIVTSGVSVAYTIPGHTRSSTTTNFWTYAPQIFGKPIPPDTGLTGNGLRGTMVPTTDGRWEVTGVPMTPVTDDGRVDAYQRLRVVVSRNGLQAGRAQPVIPVSWEMRCNLCHNTPGIATDIDILRAHDRRHGTTLEKDKPVLCAGCHADAALGAPGTAGVSTLSAAMHGAHASRMTAIQQDVTCYACHPGIQTRCLRDVHYARGMTCTDCHGSMLTVGNPARKPWVEEPRCDSCHQRAGFEFEQPATLFRNSRGHHGVHCGACHGAPHAIAPTVTASDAMGPMNQQGQPGVISNCSVCHSTPPGDPFDHAFSTSDD